MKGTLVNVAAVLIGSGLGMVLKRGISEKVQRTLMHGLALAVGVIGLQMAFKTGNMLIVILALATGAVIGETLNIDYRLNRVGAWLSAKFAGQSIHGNIGQGFVTATLLSVLAPCLSSVLSRMAWPVMPVLCMLSRC